MLCFRAKVLQFDGDCSMVGKRSEASCCLSLDRYWSQRGFLVGKWKGKELQVISGIPYQ